MDTVNKKMLKVIGANENNLKEISIDIPHNSITVITGVSGSGKSSLVYDIIFKESQRRFMESFSTYSRQYIGKLEKPDVKEITGLQPALAINQNAMVSNPRSTVGTMSGVYDYLRLLFARTGKQFCKECNSFIDSTDDICHGCKTQKIKLLSKLFSFNSTYGACETCKGLGVTEHIDINKLIADKNLTLRQGALVPTTPTGYIVYSQVRVDELNKVCKANGFSVDIQWKELTESQKEVILYGSDKVKILFGKHSLESRLKWKGITALPREESYYKGMIPIMEDILYRDRNDNILRFTSSKVCKDCEGTRLRAEARLVKIDDYSISDLSDMQLSELLEILLKLTKETDNKDVIESILHNAIKRIEYLILLGLNYLTLSRESTTLSTGESQRIKLASQVGSGLQGILYLLDEPSSGLHYRDNSKLLKVLSTLRNNGNTVVIVEHDEQTIRAADHIIDIGPRAGLDGGNVIYQGSSGYFFRSPEKYPDSLTAKYYSNIRDDFSVKSQRISTGSFKIEGASKYNLKDIDVEIKLGLLNVITGVSGAGKSTLVHEVIAKNLRNTDTPTNCKTSSITHKVKRLVEIDKSPIGRTSRSNPATYTGLFDHIRDIFSRQTLSKEKGYSKSRFSFNNKGGRCEYCEGAGYTELGMHFMGNVSITCDKCGGSRFNEETLEVTFKNKNIHEVLELSVNEALVFFEGEKKIVKILEQLRNLDVGYLKLGQTSTSLSGGEAQRVKLASELYKTSTGHMVYILDEPSTGLHKADISYLLDSINNIVDKGNTVIMIEHETDIIIQADHIIDLGPEGGDKGGQLIIQGTPEQVMNCNESETGKALLQYQSEKVDPIITESSINRSNIVFKGVTTNNLKNIDVVIPLNKTTVITGVSGSGKSSLAFDTIYSESRNRFTEGFSSYARRMMNKIKKPELEQCTGLTPAIAIGQKGYKSNNRSTVGTLSGIYDHYRLLYSRIGKNDDVTNSNYPASMFSFNNAGAACPHCNGLGIITACDPKKFVTDPEKPLIDGAMDRTNPGKFFGNPDGQYINTLLAVGESNSIDYSLPFKELSCDAKKIALYGTGEINYDVSWKFKRGSREGTHKMSVLWKGFVNYFNEEYEIKKHGKRGDAYSQIISDITCGRCKGGRLNNKVLRVMVGDKNISELSALSVDESLDFFYRITEELTVNEATVSRELINRIIAKLKQLIEIGIGYLSINRPVSTLSGGESQRLRIATQLISELCDLTYVLDEPTLGLHPRDTGNLLKTLDKLKRNGNTIIIVEHDQQVIANADHIIDIGHGAGVNGGKIIAEGSFKHIVENPESVTGSYLSKPSLKKITRTNTGKNAVIIKGASANNLNDIDVEIPLGCITVITGVSGSGKSSLAFDVIAGSYEAGSPVRCTDISFQNIDSMLVVDQQRIGTSPLSTAATYTGLFDLIRGLFAASEDSKKLNLKKAHFSFNSKDGRCPVCKGMGSVKVSMDFLSDVWVICDSCHGNRFKDYILDIKYNHKNISDVLHMEVSEARIFFENHKDISRILKILEETGLGYLKLGQSTGTLSGGETQRLKLASRLSEKNENNCLYLFDEPTTGLHMKDVEVLLQLAEKLVAEGNTVLMVEHNTDIISNADHIIDLGPEGGINGGNVVYSGTVAGIKNCRESETAKYLK